MIVMNHNSKSLFLRVFMAAVAVMMAIAVWGQERKQKIIDMLVNMPSKELVEKGLFYMNRKDDADSAMLCFTIVANRRFDEKQDSVSIKACANALNLIGLLYDGFYDDFQKAYGFFHLAEEYCEKNHFYRLLPAIHNEMAGLALLEYGINNQTDSLKSVLSMYKQAFHEGVKYQLHDCLGAIAQNMASIGISHDMIGNVSKELKEYCSIELKDTIYGPQDDNKYFCKAILEYGEGNLENALHYLRLAEGHIHGINVKERVTDSIFIYNIRCQMYEKKEMDTEFIQEVEKLIAIASRHDEHRALDDAYEGLFDFYLERGNKEMATHYELLHLREKDFLVNKGHLAGMQKMKFLIEIEKLNKEAEAMAMRDHMKSRVLWIVCFFTLLIICTLVMLYRKYRQVKEKNAQLFQKVQVQLAEIEEKKALIMQAATFQPAPTEEKAKYQKNAIGETEKSELLHRIFMVMENADDVYSNDFSLQRLAELVDGNPNYVSQVINEKYNCNFNALLNEYRIREACRRINDQEHYGNQTLDGIAQSVGIRARSTFVAAFKKFTGMTPSAYQKLAKTKVASTQTPA